MFYAEYGIHIMSETYFRNINIYIKFYIKRILSHQCKEMPEQRQLHTIYLC